MLNKLTQVYDVLRFKLERVMNFAERNAGKLVFILIAVYTLIFSSYTIFMHYAFKTYAWDLGIFTQSLWTTINLGKPFHYTIETHVNPSQNFFGAHFSPILLLIVPIYALHQSPITLLTLQSFILGLAALPTYWIARDKLNSKLWGLTFATAFLLHPALHGMNCFDFHVEAFIPLFFLLTFYYLDNKRWIKGLTFALLTLSTIEFAPILIVFLGFYFLIKISSQTHKANIVLTLKRIIIPIVLIAISIFWFFTAFHITYSINPLKATGLPGNWDIWGSSLNEVVLNVLRNPITALGVIANPIEKVYYILSVFAPTVFLSLLSPLELLLIVPWLLAALLSEYPPYYELYFQYFGFIAGQIFVAAIYGVKNLIKLQNSSKRLSGIEKKLIVLILSLSLLSTLAISPIALPALTRRRVEITSHVETLHEVLSLIPHNASIATQNDIFPHLAQRENIFILTWPMQLEVDFIIVDLKSSHFLYGPTAMSVPPDKALFDVINSTKYGMMAYADGVLLLKKDYTGEYVITQPYREYFNYEKLLRYPSTSCIGFDQSSQSGRIIIHNTNHLNDTAVWYGPYAYLFTGEYSATFRIKTKSENLSLKLEVVRWNRTTSVIKPTLTLNFSDFAALNKWQDFTLNFTIVGLQRMEVRGTCISNNTHVALDFIKVTQLGP